MSTPDDPAAIEAADDRSSDPGDGIGLAAFAPPPDDRFEEELQGEPPRPRPAEYRRGRYASGWRRAAWGFMAAGSLCIAGGLLPFIEDWGLYFLPLQYLDWIGLACLALGATLSAIHRFLPGPYRYARDGTPLMVRILALELRPSAFYNGPVSAFQFAATVGYRDPQTGEPRVVETCSNSFGAAFRDWMTTTYRVGDHATALYLGTDPARTLRLYGFLDLKPGLGLVRRDGASEAGPLRALLDVVAGFGLVGVLGWNAYASERFAPLEHRPTAYLLPFALGAAVLGGAPMALLAVHRARRRKEQAGREARAAAIGEVPAGGGVIKRLASGVNAILGGLAIAAFACFLGGFTVLCWCFTANALLDTSPPRGRPVQILGMIATTHKGIIRTYTIDYRFLDGAGEEHSFLSTPHHMRQFVTEAGVAEEHAGRFGWPWVKTIRPAAARAPGAPGG